jgi:hypothetical protein
MRPPKESECPVCGAGRHPLAKFCQRCRNLINRVDTRRKPDREARARALKQAWDGSAFRCYFSGVRLVESGSRDPRYLTFDHLVPRREETVVVAAACINDMKSDLSESEFRAVVRALASRFDGGEFDEHVFNLRHCKRG